MAENENPQLCKSCGGRCCKSMPGTAVPKDFAKPLEDSIKAALLSGNWAIDWINEDRGTKRYYMRPATTFYGGRKIFDFATFGGPCILLGPTGCNLEFEQRPFQCRELNPITPGGKSCTWDGDFDNEHLVALWAPDQLMLFRVGHEVQKLIGKDVAKQGIMVYNAHNERSLWLKGGQKKH